MILRNWLLSICCQTRQEVTNMFPGCKEGISIISWSRTNLLTFWHDWRKIMKDFLVMHMYLFLAISGYHGQFHFSSKLFDFHKSVWVALREGVVSPRAPLEVWTVICRKSSCEYPLILGIDTRSLYARFIHACNQWSVAGFFVGSRSSIHSLTGAP